MNFNFGFFVVRTNVSLRCCRCADYVRLYLDLDRPEVGEKQTANYEICGAGNHVISGGVLRVGRQQRLFYSSERTMIVEFHSDSVQTNHNGFSAKYRFVYKSEVQFSFGSAPI
jgi:hypothetical protein